MNLDALRLLVSSFESVPHGEALTPGMQCLHCVAHEAKKALDAHAQMKPALEYVREHLWGSGNYDEARRGMALRYVEWVLKPVPDGATLTECGGGHKIWRVWSPGDRCPVCTGEEP
jgi:hypothetical protein